MWDILGYVVNFYVERYNKLCASNYHALLNTFMKLSRQQQHRMYSHHDRDIDSLDDEFWPVLGILLAIWGTWTGVIHLIDWLTLDALAWYIEPLTIVPFIFLLVMSEKFDSLNPLHWWPMVWGYKIKLPDDERITIYPINGEDLIKEHGGPLHIHIIDYEHIKFRRKKDAVMYALRNF